MTNPSDILLQQSGIGQLDLPVAFDLLNRGELDLAAAAFTKLGQGPQRGMQAQAQYGLGLVAGQRGDFKQAAQHHSRAIQLDRTLAEPYVALGNAFQALQRFNQAVQAYRDGLRIAPGNALLHFNFGICLRRMGQHDAAIGAFKAALQYQPDHVLSLFSLGNAYRDQNNLGEAERFYAEAVRIRPDYADAQCNLGGIHAVREQHAQALACFDAALRSQPAHFFALKNRSLALFKLGRYAEGAAAAKLALAQQPEDMMLHYHMGEMVYGLARIGEAAQARELAAEWRANHPDNTVARHIAAAVLGDAGLVPERAEDSYVRETFDRFSADFEQVLSGLDYKAPQLLDAAVAAMLGERGGLRVLDAGCGTGLCAPLLKPRATRLVGVDLSGGMLQKAQERGLYDDLQEAELGAYLRATPEQFDLTVAADVFCYFGDLKPLLGLLAARMPADALLAFTVERIPADDAALPAEGYRLDPTGRYAHTGEYVRAALEAAGFRPDDVAENVARVELGKPVPCYVVTATRR